MSMAVTHFVSVEVLGIDVTVGFIAGLRHLALIAMVGMKTVIHVTVEVLFPMEPGSGSYKDPAIEPFRAVVSVWRAGIGRRVVIPVRTVGRRANTNSNAYLGLSFRSHGGESNHGRCC